MDIIQKLQDELQKPLNKMNGDNVQETFEKIATNLFNNFCIKCGEKRFYFAEVEFYYYEKGKWYEEWNKVTYARDGYSAGDFFYHLSGIDICFESQINPKENIDSSDKTKTIINKAHYGGILVRSIRGMDDGSLIAGPLNCKNELLNACKGCSMPQLSEIDKKREKIILKSTKRLLGKELQPKEDSLKYNLCYYDGNVKEWRNTKIKYIKNEKGIDDTVKKEHPKYNRFIVNDKNNFPIIR